MIALVVMHFCEICNYQSENISKLHKHHIIPKELNGSNDLWNLVLLCPSCHTNVFIPKCKYGNHSIKTSKSFIIESKMLSTDGMVLKYIDNNGVELFTKLKNIYKSRL